MEWFGMLRKKIRQRYDEQRRMGDVTPLSLIVCAAIVLYAVYKSYSGQ
jgi:hypothetical protein